MAGPASESPRPAPRRRPSSPRPAPAGWVAISLALSLTAFRPPGAAHELLSWCVWAALGVAYLGAWLLPLDKVRVTRHAPPVATVGRRFRVTFVVDYRGRRALRGLRLSQPGFPLRVAPLDLLPEARPLLTLELLPLRRGELSLGDGALEALGPLGLFARRAALPLPEDTLLVRPNPRPPRPPDLAPWIRRGPPLGTWATVRDWRPGDPRRWVHARLSARRGFPVVAPPERQPDARLSLGVDPALPPRSFERAVSYAAGLGTALLRGGVALDLVLDSGRTRCRGRDGRALLLDALARARRVPPSEVPQVTISVRDNSPVLLERAPL